MHQGSVDPTTTNVPLRLESGYLVHFESRDEDGTLIVRMARSITSPPLSFSDSSDLQAYLASLSAQHRSLTVEDVDEWLELRAAEPRVA